MTTLNVGYVVICNHDGCSGGEQGRPALFRANDEDPSVGFTTADEARKVAAKSGWAHWWSPGNGRGKIGRKKLDFCPACKGKEYDAAGAPKLEDGSEVSPIEPTIEPLDASIEAPC